MSDWWWAIGAVVLFALYLRHEKRRKSRAGGGPGMGMPVGFIRVRPPGSNVFRNIMVLAVVVGLGWFFWYVMGTRCNGGC